MLTMPRNSKSSYQGKSQRLHQHSHLEITLCTVICCPSNRLPRRKSPSLTKRHGVIPLLSARFVQGFKKKKKMWKLFFLHNMDHLRKKVWLFMPNLILFIYFTNKNIHLFYIFSLHPPHTHNTLLLKDHFEYGPKYYIYIKIQQEEGQSMA